MMLLAGQPFGAEAIELALRIAPPLFAPGGFLGLGAVVVALGSPKLVLHFGRSAQHALTS
jgi:hypothetical protein